MKSILLRRRKLQLKKNKKQKQNQFFSKLKPAVDKNKADKEKNKIIRYLMKERLPMERERERGGII